MDRGVGLVSEAPLRLRRARNEDLDALHALMREPSVYRYLADDEEPSRAFIADWLAAGIDHFRAHAVGLWMLEEDERLLGCVLLEPEASGERAELTYLLAPHARGRGLAVSMAVAVIRHAFEAAGFREVMAGADVPNTASVGVMKRLGMHDFRRVDYPKHEGVEATLVREDPLPTPPVELPIRD